MEAPYTIASLPTPLDTAHGRILAAPVHSLRSSKRRKLRHEVAVGIDGESVNVYNVQSQDLVTSYALPPQTYMCCPPCSVYRKKKGVAGAQRRTYTVVKDGPTDMKRRLVCLTESSERSKQLEDQLAAPSKKELKLQPGEVLNCEVIAASGETATLQVVISYRNGNVSCVSDDLTRTSWEFKLQSAEKDSEAIEVEYASITDLETARKGLLASREDVVATVDPMVTGTSDHASEHSLLCNIIRSGSQRSLRLYSVRAGGPDTVQIHSPPLQLLMEYTLPAQTKQSSERAIYELHSVTGKLYQLLDARLTVYDLTNTTPRVATSIGSKADPIVDFARVSSSSVLAASADRISVYETRYNSLQGSVALPSSHSMEVTTNKRKRLSDGFASELWHAVASFSELGIVVGLKGNELSALQLAESMKSVKRAKSAGTLLVDVLGNGAVSAPNINNVEKTEKRSREWDEWKAEVDSAVHDKRMPDLEKIVAGVLEMKVETGTKLQQNTKQLPAASLTALVLGNSDDTTPPPNAPSLDTTRVDRRKVLYILGACFSARSNEQDFHAGTLGLSTTVDSSRVYKWIACAGFLTQSYVQQGLRLRNGMSGTVSNVQPGDVMTALCSFDSFQAVHDMLALPVHWELAEVVQVLKLLVQSFETPAEGTALQKAHSAPHAGTNGDVAMVNGDADIEVESVLLATEKDHDRAVSTLSTGLELRSKTLRLLLRRIHAFPQKAVTKAMRAMMKHEELIFFMKILRMELLDGGWTSRYSDLGDADDAAVNLMDGAQEVSGPSDQAIGTISDLMNCAIDAVGTNGWLVGHSGDAYGTEELIDALKSEVSASLEGLFEADTVATFLHDLQRYKYSLAKKEQTSEKRRKRRRGEPEEELAMEAEILPVGCQAEMPVAIGGGLKDGKKTKHVYEKERRGRVGKYSIDRIGI
ncbi:hypothetical protein LTR08_000265 [Meristemomyces frigidus]|nr:hypothetical protein LTR08_000265 [Meristemomyces frigidus]